MFYSFALYLFLIYFRLFYRWRVFGRENIPAGKFIVCSNHIDWLDPPLVACSLGAANKINFMAKAELFRVPVFSVLIGKLGAFPVHRDRPDRRAIQLALQLLQDERILGMFPEGTRRKSEDEQQLLNGAA